MVKVVFLDVDGTLVDYHNRIPESAIKAIRQARQNGHLVYISTGRSKSEVYSEIWDIGLDGMIGGNGSYVEDHGQVIMHQVLSKEDSKNIVDWLKARNLEFYLESNSGLYASQNFEEVGRPTVQAYSKSKGKEDVEHITVRTAFPEMIFGADVYRDDLNKVSFVLNSYQDHLDSKKAFPHLKAGTWGGVGETALFGDLGVENITKAHAIEVLLDHLGASKEDTFAFGDAKIDIPMLDYCEVGVAMGNGGPEIKAMADYITDDVEEDGLWKAFVHFGLV
ncbi:HAD family hydrolase [Granulicatella seriolae]|uniref:Cof-type HAD-IIB family hydrolase n=1 Tax=Granulicatella seriolae TaxID=2967226 RepID=A0ABT1WPE9_9LACT|nr:HAD family hydrolase [Granulicatella seriolae]